MKCFVCKRPLIHSAAPPFPIGPTCAKNRGLLPEKPTRFRKVEDEGREVDPRQVDWVNYLAITKQREEPLTTGEPVT